MEIKQVLDAKGLSCPMPIVRTKKAIDQLESGEVLQVLTTDKGSKTDIAAWSESTGHKLLDVREEDGVFTFLIEKK